MTRAPRWRAAVRSASRHVVGGGCLPWRKMLVPHAARSGRWEVAGRYPLRASMLGPFDLVDRCASRSQQRDQHRGGKRCGTHLWRTPQSSPDSAARQVPRNTTAQGDVTSAQLFTTRHLPEHFMNARVSRRFMRVGQMTDPCSGSRNCRSALCAVSRATTFGDLGGRGASDRGTLARPAIISSCLDVATVP